MDRQTLLGVGLVSALSTALALGAGAWLLAPELGAVEISPRVAALDVPAEMVRTDAKRRPAPKKKRVEKPAKGAKREDRAKARTKPKPKPPPQGDERLELRENRLVGTNDRLDRYAAQAGWDDETTELVREILIDTADKVSETLAQVDAGELTMDDVRDELTEFRLQQAADVKALIGEDAFPAFTHAMGFDRFVGDDLLPANRNVRPAPPRQRQP